VLAYTLSERFDVPFFLRTTNGVSHSKGIVRFSQRKEKVLPPFDPLSPKFRPQGGIHPIVLHQNGFERLKRMEKYAEKAKINRIEWGDRKIGIISSGITYQYAKEVLPFASFLKLGMTYPLPHELIKFFAAKIEELYIIEEMEPFLEEQIRAMGIKAKGSELRPHAGGLSREMLTEIFSGTLKRFGQKSVKSIPPFPQVIKRFPTMCSGCLHLAIYYAIRRLRQKMKDKDVVVMGDIGCYSLGIAAPHSILGCAFAMGSGISSAHGLSKALNGGSNKVVLSYIGDSTFLHAGISSLLNALYNESNITAIIADNGTTAMTGGQEHAGTGKTIQEKERIPVNLRELCQSLGVTDLYEVDPYDYQRTYEALTRAVAFKGVSVVIAKRPCCLFPKKLMEVPYRVLSEKCSGCGVCMTIYCPSIIVSDKKSEKGKSQAVIDSYSCVGCSFCAQICPTQAIVQMA
jgi:indolepyruvate ferredoxin oxidoreductase alpha subunit